MQAFCFYFSPNATRTPNMINVSDQLVLKFLRLNALVCGFQDFDANKLTTTVIIKKYAGRFFL